MKTITRTYKDGCKWCKATGRVPNTLDSSTSMDTMIRCPVCDGTKTIVITDKIPILYKVTISGGNYLIPILTTEQVIDLREAMERDRANIPDGILFGKSKSHGKNKI